MIFLIILIFLVSILSFKSIERFTCNRNLYYTNKIFRPLRMMIVDESGLPDKNTVDKIINKNLINKALSNIKLSYPTQLIYELNESGYDYKKGFTGKQYNKELLDSINDKFSNVIIKYVSQQIKQSFSKFCNKNCDINYNGYRIKRLGLMNKKLVIEGQQLFELTKGSKIFMIEYVIINNKNLDIFRVKLGGIEFKKIIQSQEDSEKDITQDKLNILGSPLYGRYDLPKHHLYSSLEKKLKPPNKFKNIDKFSYFCYGKKALNQIDCEKIDDTNKRGVWDKACEDDRECPFYRIGSNKGGCKKGQCEFPIGVDRISPRKYINLKNAVCSGCKYTIIRPLRTDNIVSNGNCCISQMNNKKRYPNLTMPNYVYNQSSL